MAPEPAFSRALGRVALAIFAGATAVGIYAAAVGRALHADGAHYLVKLLAFEWFNLAEPSRVVVHVLTQAPVVAAMRLGLVDLDGARFLYCLALELVPLLPLALCYAALPAGRKAFFYFPLLHYLTATLAAAASPIVEGVVAVGYFWLVFYLILFAPLRGWRLAIAALLALPLAVLHESIALLGFFPAIAAAWRARRETGLRAVGFWIVALLCVAGAAAELGFVLVPRSAAQRSDVLEGLINFYWIYAQGGGFNLPAILGLVALAVLSLLPARRPNGSDGPGAWRMAAFVAVLALAVPIVAFALPVTVTPWPHFAARHIPGLYALGFAAAVFVSLVWPDIQRLWLRPATLGIVVALGAGSLGWHAAEAAHWASFTRDIRDILASSRGVVPRDAAIARLDARGRILFRNMAWSWSMPDLSVVLAPGGRVASVIGRLQPVPWEWSLSDPSQMPRSRYFDLTDFIAAIGARPARETKP